MLGTLLRAAPGRHTCSRCDGSSDKQSERGVLLRPRGYLGVEPPAQVGPHSAEVMRPLTPALIRGSLGASVLGRGWPLHEAPLPLRPQHTELKAIPPHSELSAATVASPSQREPGQPAPCHPTEPQSHRRPEQRKPRSHTWPVEKSVQPVLCRKVGIQREKDEARQLCPVLLFKQVKRRPASEHRRPVPAAPRKVRAGRNQSCYLRVQDQRSKPRAEKEQVAGLNLSPGLCGAGRTSRLPWEGLPFGPVCSRGRQVLFQARGTSGSL